MSCDVPVSYGVLQDHQESVGAPKDFLFMTWWEFHRSSDSYSLLCISSVL